MQPYKAKKKLCGFPETGCTQVLRRWAPSPQGQSPPLGMGSHRSGRRRELSSNQERSPQQRDTRASSEEMPRSLGLSPGWQSHIIPGLENLAGSSLRGWSTGPPQTLGPQNRYFLCRAGATKVIWKLPPHPSHISPGPGPEEGTERRVLAGILPTN